MDLIFDIEANGLLYEADTIWCIVAKDTKTNKFYTYRNGGDIKRYLELLSSANKLIGHNILGYDVPLLRKLYGFDVKMEQLEDTFIMSCLFNNDISGGHGLEAWGNRLGCPKGSHTDWTKYSDEMYLYCKQDVEVCHKVWNHLSVERGRWDWEQSLKLEYRIAEMQSRQEQHGVLFDLETAYDLTETIQMELDTVSSQLLAQMPKQVHQVGATVSKPFLKNGKYSKMVTEWFPELTDL